MQTLLQWLKEKPELRFIFTGGKGGVGKTVSAAGIAIQYAGQGKRTLLASLNPVHSLSSVFGQSLSGGALLPVKDVANLFAVEVETQEVVARYRDSIGRRVREFLKWADIPIDAKPFVDIAVTNPAFEESAMFDKMMDIMLGERGNYDVIVFDTAAVANAVRLIGLSKIYGLWLGRMIESRKQALSLRVQLSFRKERMMEEVKKDPLMADLIGMNERFLQVKDLLVDPEQTAFFFVTLPLALPISVVKRFIGMVSEYSIPVGGVLVNQVLPPEIVSGHPDESYLQNKYQEQLGYMKIIKDDLGELVRGFIPLYDDEIAGLRMIQKATADLFSYEPSYWSEL
ncbi:MAG: ArsA family ATPase [Ktedonobacteraceae bacterium]|nr:ArsA family ATPase [Ktedonobacteraceae bacterium]